MRVPAVVSKLVAFLVLLGAIACGDNYQAATPTQLQVTPSSVEVVIGGSAELSAVARVGGLSEPATGVTWTSTDPAIATVTSTGTAATVVGVASGTTTVIATLGSLTAQATVVVSGATLESIAITPPAPSLAAGTTTQLTATGTYSDATTVDVTAMVTWASSADAVASVDAAGVLTGATVGTATLTATLGTISGSTEVTVTDATLVSIAVTPPAPSIAAGTTAPLTATGTFSDTTTQDLTAQVTWTSSADAVATVATDGEVTAVASGTATITATLGAIAGTATVTVTDATLVSIAVTPVNPALPRGTTQPLVATGTYSDATTQDLTEQVTWASAAPAIATVSNTPGDRGLATALEVGTAEISATAGAISGATTITVTAAELASIAVTPVNPAVPHGRTQQFTATGTYTDMTTLDLTLQVAWSSTDEAVATISNADGTRGLATTVTVGPTTIRATLGTRSGETTLTVTAAVLESIAITPVDPSIARGLTQQLVATGTYSDTSTRDLTDEVTWASATPAVVAVSNAASSEGLAEALAEGTSVVSATLASITGSTTITVTSAEITSIQVTPINPTVAAGLTLQFTATATFTDATTDDVTTAVTWTSATPAVAQISNAAASEGVASALTTGTTVIRATLGGVDGTTTLTVGPGTLVSIQVTPIDPTASAGATVPFTATGTYSDNSTQDVTTQVTWASSTMTVAQISNAAGSEGRATTLAEGTTTISATLGLVTGSTTLTVTDAVLVSIQVTPVNPSIANGRTQQFVATGTYSDLSTAPITDQVTWTSTTPAVATISNAPASPGLATSASPGTTTIRATQGLVDGETTLTVTPAVLVSIAITPSAPSAPRGRTLQLAATGTYSDNTTADVTQDVAWSSADPTRVQVSNASGSQGLASALEVGTSAITATLGAIESAPATFTVSAAVLESIAVTPVDPSVARGRTQQFTATGTYSDATTQPLTAEVTWTSADPAVAQISNATSSEGLASTLAVGTSLITATLDTVTGSTTLTVTAAELVSIAVTPANPTLAVNASQQFTATGTYTDTTTQDLTTQVTWESSAPAVAQISNAATSEGLATATGTGTATISATLGTIAGSTTLTVAAAPPPEVASTTPADAATAVASPTPIAVTFTQAMDASTLIAQTTAGACTGSVQLSYDDFATCTSFATAAPTMSAGDTVATFTPAPAVAFGTTYKIRVTMAAAASATGTPLAATFTQAAGFTTRTDEPCASKLVISQAYGGGGNSGSVYRNDFVELHNPGATDVPLIGMAIQLTSSAGPAWTVQALPDVIVPPGGYYLIQEAAGNAGTTALPAPDLVPPMPFAMGATSFKVALTSSTVALVGACPTSTAIVDLLGAGTTANCSEGNMPAPAPSNTNSSHRRNAGCVDANVNATDFVSAIAAPRSGTTTAPLVCSCAVNETSQAAEADFCVLQHPPATTAAPNATTELIFGRIFEGGVTSNAGPDATVRAEIGFGPTTVNPQNQPGFTWLPATFNVQVGNDDEYQRTLVAPMTPGTYAYTTRFSLDGINWTYCDLDGAGSNPGLAFDPTKLGRLTVP